MSPLRLSENVIPESIHRNSSFLRSTLLLAAGLFLISVPGFELHDIFGLISDFTLR